MSLAVTKLKCRVYENENHNVKKIGGGEGDGGKEQTKRAAFGELQNRILTRGNSKDVLNKDLKDVKARVDTHWKKGTLPVLTNNTNNGSAIATKPLTRSNSFRTNAVAKPAAAATTSNAKLTTLTTKVVENKLQPAKIVKKDKAAPLPIETKLRREDSNLSRKSLTQIKAAIAREVTTKFIASKCKISANVKSQQLAKEKAITVEEQQQKSETVTVEKVENVITQTNAVGLRIVSVKSHSTVLLDLARNIDENDKESLILVSEYVNDVYAYLFQLETEQPIRKHHLENQVAVTPKMRAVLIDWINEVHAEYSLVTETFHMTVAIIDRYLQAVHDTNRSNLQLVGVTALFIAAKYEELFPPTTADFVYITDQTYNMTDIIRMEMQILRALDFNLSRPLPIHFLRRFSKAADIEDAQHSMSKYFLELASIDYELAGYHPSEIAAASLFLTLNLSKGNPKIASGFNNSYWDATLQYYSHYTPKQLRPIARMIAELAYQAPKAKLNAVYKKYQSSKFLKASLRSEFDSVLMDSIINGE